PVAYPDCDIFHCRVKEIDEEGKLIRVSEPSPVFETGLEFIVNRMKGGRLHCAPDFMCRTLKLKEAGGFVNMPLAWGTDDLTWFTLALKGGIACCPEPLVSWRRSKQQVSFSGDVELRLAAVHLYREWVTRLLQNFQPATEDETNLLRELKSIYPRGMEDQKNFLVQVHSRNSTLGGHFRFFIRNSRKYRLDKLWFMVTFVRKVFNRA
ncbi:MAG: hypothetical protein NTW16_17040, partial [Bacteroidetes bacterium]|nr:hypothetical protein [Bacteroidota bacterium]